MRPFVSKQEVSKSLADDCHDTITSADQQDSVILKAKWPVEKFLVDLNHISSRACGHDGTLQ
jgi:hypothetical protein